MQYTRTRNDKFGKETKGTKFDCELTINGN